MDILTIVITAAVGVVASAITAYITVRINSKHERKKYEREIALKMADYSRATSTGTRELAIYFAEGFLLVEKKSTPDRQKVFLRLPG